MQFLQRIVHWWSGDRPAPSLIIRAGHAILEYIGLGPTVIATANKFAHSGSAAIIATGRAPEIEITANPPPADPTISFSDGVATMSYNSLVGERNKPPTIDDVSISTSGAYAEGDTLTATIDGEMHGPFTVGTHEYQWYRIADLNSGVLTTIVGATSAQYAMQAADVDNYLLCAARFVQLEGLNNKSDWFYSEPTQLIGANSGGGTANDIEHNWEDFLNIESGESVPANWNDAGISPTLINLGSGSGSWAASDLTKPLFDVDKLVFSGGQRVNGNSQTFPPVVEIWIKGRFTANNGTMIGWGSQTLFGMNSSNQWFVRDIVMMAGDLNEHVFRIVLNGANSKFQVDNGTVVTFTQNFTSASVLALGQTYSGANFADCEIKRLQRTHDGTVLTDLEVADKWAYHGF